MVNRINKFQATFFHRPTNRPNLPLYVPLSPTSSPSPSTPPNPHSQPIHLPPTPRVDLLGRQRIIPVVAPEAASVRRALVPESVGLFGAPTCDVLARRVPAVAARVVGPYTAPVCPADKPSKTGTCRAPVILAPHVAIRPCRLAHYACSAGVVLVAVWAAGMVKLKSRLVSSFSFLFGYD